MIKISIAALAFLASATAFPKDSEGNIAIKGVGTLPCSSFIESAAKDSPELQQYAGYLAGYVSAYNELNAGTFDLLPWQRLDTLMLLVLQRCQQVPQSKVAGVVSQMAQYFAKDKLNEIQEKVEIKGPLQSIFLYPSVKQQVINSLKEKGYQTTNLWKAMQQYKQDNKMDGDHPFEQLILLKLLYGNDRQN